MRVTGGLSAIYFLHVWQEMIDHVKEAFSDNGYRNVRVLPKDRWRDVVLFVCLSCVYFQMFSSISVLVCVAGVLYHDCIVLSFSAVFFLRFLLRGAGLLCPRGVPMV